MYDSLMKRLLPRTIEEEESTLAFVGFGGQDTHGKYLDHGKFVEFLHILLGRKASRHKANRGKLSSHVF